MFQRPTESRPLAQYCNWERIVCTLQACIFENQCHGYFFPTFAGKILSKNRDPQNKDHYDFDVLSDLYGDVVKGD